MPSLQVVGLRAVHRDISRNIQIRANNSTTTVTQQVSPSPSADDFDDSAETSNVHLSTSVKSLIGVFAVVGCVILFISSWKIRASYRRKYRAAKGPVLVEKRKSEKNVYPITLADSNDLSAPHKAVLVPVVSTNPGVGWTPQIREVTLPNGLMVPPVAVTATPRTATEFGISPKSAQLNYDWTPPPPTYGSALLTNIPAPPPPPQQELPDVPPPTPVVASSKSKALSVKVAPKDTFEVPPIPSPSPRSASITASFSTNPAVSHGAQTSFGASFPGVGNALPRLMTVVTDFAGTRDDELAIRAGETLRLLEEFEDQWCLVQRVGRSDAEKGVIPRFCLSEREQFVEKQRRTMHNFAFTGVKRK
ncbi:hypothetical protein FA95DRAFT_1568282 [Auriscalpium vulgare]|uniref:Uncharacterized protein n=1 Tax=Auriscalpium vulgare TaxID=40419 RepID=A0ACB8SE09_9AGAM|nr:hypothetical protein FA95DRAFT_1568282 [Auriscalpium vulgare]